MFQRAAEGSTTRLLRLCLGYFVFYVITGLTVKYFLGSPERGLPGMNGIEYLVYSSIGGMGLALGVVLVLRWYHLDSHSYVQFGPFQIPREALYIIPSGICTAVVIPTTTLMYTLPISVMVAMVIMRGAIIVVSRVIDAIQIRQGILKKKVYREENLGVVFAILAVSVKILWTPSLQNSLADFAPIFEGLRVDPAGGGGGFEFLKSKAAMSILGSYLIAYAIRLYIMNYFKNDRVRRGLKSNNQAFFGIEQISAFVTAIVMAVLVYNAPRFFGSHSLQIDQFRSAIQTPHAMWPEAILAGTAFGIVAFFSVFIFMFKGRTATFVGLVNRLTSLIAGTTSTLLFWAMFGGRFPKVEDWISLLFILIAVGFLSVAEKRRSVEIAAENTAGEATT